MIIIRFFNLLSRYINLILIYYFFFRLLVSYRCFFFFQAEDGIRDADVTGVQTCALPIYRKLIQFDLLRETWERTNLQFARAGSLVNLERSLPANGRVGGHFMTGHIDGVGRIICWERAGQDHVLEIAAPPDLMRYVVFKGSIAVDGISLTVATAAQTSFRIWIIPHTYEVTALRERAMGDAVNLEADLLGKYVERFLERQRNQPD